MKGEQTLPCDVTTPVEPVVTDFLRIYAACALKSAVEMIWKIWEALPVARLFMTGTDDVNAGLCLFLRALYSSTSPGVSPGLTDVDAKMAEATLPMRFRMLKSLIEKVGLQYFPFSIRMFAGTYAGRLHYVTKYLQSGIKDKEIEQIIILGAGFDTSSYRLNRTRPDGKTIIVYEVDLPVVQERKIAAVKAVLSASELKKVADGIVYVACDFERDTLSHKLKDSGLNPSLNTLILWEGVTYYLTRRAIFNTLDELRSMMQPVIKKLGTRLEDESASTEGALSPLLSTPTSGTTLTIAATETMPDVYLCCDFVYSHDVKTRGLGSLTKQTGAPFISGFDPITLKEDFQEHGWKVLEAVRAIDVVADCDTKLYEIAQSAAELSSFRCDIHLLVAKLV